MVDAEQPLKVIMTPLGSAGDVHPYIGLGAALRARGHDVVVITNAAFRDTAQRAGLQFIEHGTVEEYHEIIDDSDLWHPRRGPKLVLGTAANAIEALYESVESAYEPGRSMLVHHVMSFGARVFEDAHPGTPAATLHLAPISLRSEFAPPAMRPGQDLSRYPAWTKRIIWWLADRLICDPVIVGDLNQLRNKVGLAPVARPMHRWLNSPCAVVGMFPEWFADAQPDWPTNFVHAGFPLWDDPDRPDLAEAVDQFIEADNAPIVFTFGTPNRQAGRQYAVSMAAARRIGRRAILLTAHPEQLPDKLPVGVLHAAYAPFSRVLPRCAAIAHHGGIGTTSQSLAAGIPQLIVPMAFDQPDHATRVRKLGVGAWINPGKYQVDRAARALEALLVSTSTRTRCQEIASQITRGEAIDRTCAVFERVARLVLAAQSTDNLAGLDTR